MTWGLFTASLFFALPVTHLVLALWQIKANKPSTLIRILLFMLVHSLGIINLPGQELSPAAYIWSVLADSSMASFIFISYYLAGLLFDEERIDKRQIFSLACLLVVLSFIYFPLVLGLGRVDVYSWGINSYALIFFLGGISFVMTFTPYKMIAFWLGLTLLAWSVDLGESVNLFDYLLDPLAFFWSLYIIAEYSYTRRKSARLLLSKKSV